MDSYKIEVDVYHKDIGLLIFESKEELNSYSELEGDFDYNAATTVINGDVTMLFALDVVHVGTVAHECFHAAYWYLNGKGLVISDDSEEAYAYMIDFLVDKVWGIIEDYKSKDVISS
jgi:hypothetical protein